MDIGSSAAALANRALLLVPTTIESSEAALSTQSRVTESYYALLARLWHRDFHASIVDSADRTLSAPRFGVLSRGGAHRSEIIRALDADSQSYGVEDQRAIRRQGKESRYFFGGIALFAGKRSPPDLVWSVFHRSVGFGRPRRFCRSRFRSCLRSSRQPPCPCRLALSLPPMNFIFVSFSWPHRPLLGEGCGSKN